MDLIAQIMIVVLGGLAIALLSVKRFAKWGHIAGLCSEPFWAYVFIVNKQFLLLLLVVWYTIAFGNGIYNYWIKK
ncbi:hypothetical protein LCGC14_0475910 [marine sediment metagenome]|uniref:Uncharacterized protein n=1 Tax=marine sediment metagenome TaxID=412755 RepID=A0A0F9SG18_9ZZZZ